MQPTPNNPFSARDGLIVFAHRGERGHYPENTLLAFEKAARHDVDALELDIHCTADGVPIVFHDATLERTTNGAGPVRSRTLAELQQLDAGYWWTADHGQSYPFRARGVTIPTLEEVLAAFPDLWINIDIKQHDTAVIPSFVQLIRRVGMASRLMVGSFDNRTVARFRAACPEVATAASLAEVRRLLAFSRLGLPQLYRGAARALQIPETYRGLRLVDERLVAAAHRCKVAVHVWTVNDLDGMRRLIHLGVDGVMTDHPARLLSLLGRPTAALEARAPRRRVTLFFVRNGKLLLIERYRDGAVYTVIPGGGVDPGETVQAAALREAHEETGLEVTLGPLLWERPRDDQFEYAFLVADFAGEPRLGSPEFARQSPTNRYELVWVPLEEVNGRLPYPGLFDLQALRAHLPG
jgi:glycerophosphoryl diester phosphodiesterase